MKAVQDTLPPNNGNYPPSGDSAFCFPKCVHVNIENAPSFQLATSEGGSSGDALSRRAQRGIDNTKVKSQENASTTNSSISQNGTRTPDSFGASKIQPTENKSTGKENLLSSAPEMRDSPTQ